tara:strand:+ start:228 stop:428 length:201 start_codon:yes stop_codon:yes gene_type:complete
MDTRYEKFPGELDEILGPEESGGVSLTITEGHIILVAEVLRIERGLEKLPMADATKLLTQAVKNIT